MSTANVGTLIRLWHLFHAASLAVLSAVFAYGLYSPPSSLAILAFIFPYIILEANVDIEVERRLPKECSPCTVVGSRTRARAIILAVAAAGALTLWRVHAAGGITNGLYLAINYGFYVSYFAIVMVMWSAPLHHMES